MKLRSNISAPPSFSSGRVCLRISAGRCCSRPFPWAACLRLNTCTIKSSSSSHGREIERRPFRRGSSFRAVRRVMRARSRALPVRIGRSRCLPGYRGAIAGPRADARRMIDCWCAQRIPLLARSWRYPAGKLAQHCTYGRLQKKRARHAVPGSPCCLEARYFC